MVREEEGMKRKKEGRKLVTLRSFTFLQYTLQNLGPVPASPTAFLNLLIPPESHSVSQVVVSFLRVCNTFEWFYILQSCHNLDSCKQWICA